MNTSVNTSTLYLTWFDNNSWLIEIGGQRILLDPWLVGDLVFGNMPWFFSGVRPHPRPIPPEIDLILLSQGLPDHAHPPTLKQLDRSIPVVGSPNAAKVVEELGYTQITSLAHSEHFTLANRVQIRAIPGAPIGPTLIENAYVLTDQSSGISLYYEPHGYPSPELKDLAPIDLVITPMLDLSLPLLGRIIQGSDTPIQLAQWVHPQIMIPTTAPGSTVYEGWLTRLLQSTGGPDQIRQSLHQQNLNAKIVEPQSGERLELILTARGEH